MRVLAIIGIVSFLFILGADHIQGIEKYIDGTEEVSVLQELIEVAEFDQLELEKWEIVLKQSFEKGERESIREALQAGNFTESAYIETEEAVTERWTNDKRAYTTETLSIIKEKSANRIQVTYHIESKEPGYFNEKEIALQINKSIGQTFTTASRNYTCIELVDGGMIDSVYFFQTIIDQLEVKDINRIEEEDFIVVSGFTDLWDTAIPVGDSEMNIQMASRKGLNEKTTFTLGTPILTTEY